MTTNINTNETQIATNTSTDMSVNTTTNSANNIENHVIELLAEQPKIDIERLEVGKLQVRKEIRTKQIQLPITLKQEVLVIDHVTSQQLANALPDTALRPQNPTDSSDWDSWVKIDNATPIATKILVNGQPYELQQPLEIVVSQEFAHVQIQTLLAETVQISTTTEERVETIPVQLRHEELVTNQVNYDTPKVLHREEVIDASNNNATLAAKK